MVCRILYDLISVNLFISSTTALPPAPLYTPFILRPYKTSSFKFEIFIHSVSEHPQSLFLFFLLLISSLSVKSLLTLLALVGLGVPFPLCSFITLCIPFSLLLPHVWKLSKDLSPFQLVTFKDSGQIFIFPASSTQDNVWHRGDVNK